jgi:hypothetical protein
LGKTSTFVRVEVDVIYVERGVLEVRVEHRWSRRFISCSDNVALVRTSKFNVNYNFVVLESN